MCPRYSKSGLCLLPLLHLPSHLNFLLAYGKSRHMTKALIQAPAGLSSSEHVCGALASPSPVLTFEASARPVGKTWVFQFYPVPLPSTHTHEPGGNWTMEPSVRSCAVLTSYLSYLGKRDHLGTHFCWTVETGSLCVMEDDGPGFTV